MKRFLPAAALAVLAMAPPLLAQQQDPVPGGNQQNRPGTQNNNRTNRAQPPARPIVVWKAELPGGSYVVARERIEAISSQQYILDGAARVTEVNISTAGAFQSRFYYLEPLATALAADAVPGGQIIADQAQTQVQSAVNRIVPGDPVWAKVVKNYPTTTHAGTIEFRLETREQLDKLFESVERTWISGKSEIFTPTGVKPYGAKKKSEDAAGDEQDAATPDAGETDADN